MASAANESVAFIRQPSNLARKIGQRCTVVREVQSLITEQLIVFVAFACDQHNVIRRCLSNGPGYRSSAVLNDSCSIRV